MKYSEVLVLGLYHITLTQYPLTSHLLATRIIVVTNNEYHAYKCFLQMNP